MQKYTTPSIRDLGAVADLTQAFVDGPGVDNVRFDVPNPGPKGGTVVVVGTLSGIPSPFPKSNR